LGQTEPDYQQRGSCYKEHPEIVFNVQIISATIIYLKQLFGWQEILFSYKQFS